VTVHELSRADVRRIAVRAQLLDSSPFNKTMTEGIGREIDDLARWLGLDLALPR
jgi:uncharacterized protein YcaQ